MTIYAIVEGHECRITNMYDCAGVETTDIKEAVTVVAKPLDCDGWFNGYIEFAQLITVH